jgi:hypothetical protein
METERKIEGLWLDRASCAALCSITAKHFDDFLRPKLAKGSARGDRRKLRFWAPDVVAAWVASKVAKLELQIREAAAAEGDPLMFGGGDGKSPALEKYRGIKAKHAELDLRVREGELVELRELEPALMSMAEVLRRHGSIMAKKFGGEAAGLMAEALEEWIRGVERRLKRADDEDDGSPAGAALPAD